MPWLPTKYVMLCVTEATSTRARGYFFFAAADVSSRCTPKVAPSVTEPSSFVAVTSAT